MAAAVTVVRRTVWGDRKVIHATIAFDSSYPTGGEAITLADLGLKEVDFCMASPKAGYVPEWDDANSKMLMYWGDNNNASDGPLIEVADTTNLAAITALQAIFVGY